MWLPRTALADDSEAQSGSAMNKGQSNLQDIFLNQARKENAPVTVYLVTGVQLKGYIRGFDAFTVILESPGKPLQLVYKHALASVVPAKHLSFREDTGAGRPAREEPAQPQSAPAAPTEDSSDLRDEAGQ